MTGQLGIARYLLPGGDVTLLPPPGGLWVCSVCGKRSTWTADHAWHGSLADVDGGMRGRAPRPIVVACSTACMERAAAEGLTS